MQDVSEPQACVSDLQIDSALAGALSDRERSVLASHLAACLRCRQRWEAFEAERARFLDAAPDWPSLQVRVARDRSARTGRPTVRPWPGFWSWSAALATAAALALAVLQTGPFAEPPAMTGDASAPETTRAKGGGTGLRLGFYLKRDGRVVRARPDTVVHPGEQLRFVYSSGRSGYLAVIDRDARGASQYYPEGPVARPATAGQDIPLDFSVQLDDTLGPETVVALMCDDPIALAPLLRALGKTDPHAPVLAAPAGCVLDAILLRKEPFP